MSFKKINSLKNENLNKKIFNFITTNLKNSIFTLLGYEFYRNVYLVNNYQNIFLYIIKKEISILISYIDEESESKLKKKMYKYLILRPFKIILLFKNINFFFKSSKGLKNYIQLLHFVIKKSFIFQMKKEARDKKIHQLHKKFIKNRYKGIYALYNNDNLAAEKYYKKNNFTLYNKNLFYSFVKKRIY